MDILRGFTPARDACQTELHDRELTQKWLKLKQLPSERFTEGLMEVIGRTVLILDASGNTEGFALVAAFRIADTIDSAAAAYVRKYVKLAGSVYS